jgi:hypothetical protein
VIAGKPPAADLEEHGAQRVGAMEIVENPEELLLEVRLPLDGKVHVAEELVEDGVLIRRWRKLGRLLDYGHRLPSIDHR